MAVFKCKMCGGALEVNDGMTVCECEYCGTVQTLPKLNDDKKANLYDRAGHFRRSNEFDKAISIYEKILEEDKTDSEAYWSLVLCRYGIEYVEDPSSHKRIPTINRVQYTSVLADEDYKSALEYADSEQKKVYEKEARAIDGIQKGILEISNKEEPFDVFICYKETDDNGRRTPDSVLANDLYHQLTNEGFKVFFSRITLEDKIGTAYEPYIFAALNSAKVMVVLGTKPEYFNAVWVKNEWSRYLALMKNNSKKILIPAYRDMDPYDLPEEFSHLQAQDMSKLGFMQDLIRGINKLAKEPAKEKIKETVVVNQAGTNTEPLLERAFMFLEDGDWNSADEYCEKVLDIDPKCAQAYLGKLLAELKVHNEDELPSLKRDFSESSNYNKAVRFGYSKVEELNKQAIYDGYIDKMNNAVTDTDFRNVKKLFNSIKDYKDAEQKAEECEEKALDYRYSKALKSMKSAGSEISYRAAAEKFKELGGFKDSAEKEKECIEKAEDARKESIYNKAGDHKQVGDIDNIKNAIELYEKISGYKESGKKLAECREILQELITEKEEKEKEREKQEMLRKKEAERIAKRNKKIAVIVSSAIAAVILFVIILDAVILPKIEDNKMMEKYNSAMDLYNDGKYKEAISAFKAISDYKDSAEMINKANDLIIEEQYLYAMQLYNDEKYDEAVSAFEALSDYKDSGEMINKANDIITESKYLSALDHYNNQEFKEAYALFNGLGEYKDSSNYAKELKENVSVVISEANIGETVLIYSKLWFLLDKTEDSALLLLYNIVEHEEFNKNRESVTWENSSIREYLNNDYYNNLSEEYKNMIIETNLTNPANSEYGTDCGNDTVDKVFLLSAEEADKYLRGKVKEVFSMQNNSGYWWLRTSGKNNRLAAFSDDSGEIYYGGEPVYDSWGVRPAIWVKY